MKIFKFAVLLSLALFISCSRASDNIPIIDKALNDGESAFYGNFSEYPKDLASLPIGVFDSGTGGLTVLERILTLDNYNNVNGVSENDGMPDFAEEKFVYLADQANMPYGQYDGRGKADYLRELAVKDALFLMKSPAVKIIVIACNTATAYGLGDVRSLLAQSGTGVKVIGVINAGVKATLDCLGADSGECSVGVLATPGTISSGAYERTMNSEAALRGMNVKVVSQSGYGFAESVDSEPGYVFPAAKAVRAEYMGPKFGEGDADLKRSLLPAYNFEEDGILKTLAADGSIEELQLNTAANYARFNLVSLLEKHRQSGSRVPMRAIILGCTHYPFLLGTMKKALDELRVLVAEDGTYPYRDLIPENVVFIDPAVYTADECYKTLMEDGNLAPKGTEREVATYISVPAPGLPADVLNPDGSLTYEFKYGRETGTEDITVVQEPFSKTNISENNLKRLQELVPVSYSLFSKSF